MLRALSRKLSFLLAIMLTLSLLAGCGGAKPAETKPAESGSTPAPAPAPAKPAQVQNINVATATTAGVYYPLGNAFAMLWNEKVPGVKASAQATAGTVENVKLMGRKEAEVAFAQNGVIYYAVSGTESFAAQGKQSFLRGMTHLYPNVMQIAVRKDANIKSLADLKGKKFVPGANGSATELNSREILGVAGIDYRERKDIAVDYLDYGQAAEAIKNRQAHGNLIAGGLPTAAVIDMFTSGDVELLNLSENEVAAITKKYPWYFKVVIPKGTYKGQEADVVTVAVANILVTREDLPEELIYNLTKSLYDNHDSLVKSHSAAADMKLEDGLKGITGVLELHPGAAKFFKEKGVLK
ncbi:MAG TPA: TAXI family TRAP transporter solute-binding subunit [Symbiobacteriaceae bacterium]|nr:TAXI family TRAP transporter solute-binding subunit [Symbiobacteriaceae bacterium]